MFTIFPADKTFPPLLSEIYDPPILLRASGQPLNPQDQYFAIVGTRRPSPYGKQMAEEFAYMLARRGFTIVSGLAYGIDAIAHEAALEAGGKTIAVLGGGFNASTWASLGTRRQLAKKICGQGTLLTEFEEDVHPSPNTFPQRNRIIAGMSRATLVIEAPVQSGALITARFALGYNRDVFVLPGNITQETSRGGNELIRDGKAFPVTCIEDIFEHMGMESKMAGKNSQTFPSLNEDETIIYQLIKNSPRSVDTIISETNLPASRVNTALTMLEVKGLINNSGFFVTARHT